MTGRPSASGTRKSKTSADSRTARRSKTTADSKTNSKPRGRRGKPSAKPKPKAHGRLLRSGHLLRAALIVGTLGAGMFVAVYPIDAWLDQRQELEDVRARQVELLGQVAEIDNQIASLQRPEGIDLRARCFGPYVKPGTETYQIPGLSGCLALQ